MNIDISYHSKIFILACTKAEAVNHYFSSFITYLGCLITMDSHGEDGGLLGGGNKPSNCIVEKDEKGDVKSSS